VRNWEIARRLDPCFPIVHRNLAVAAHNEERNAGKAVRLLKKAFSLDPRDARMLHEVDLLQRVTGGPPARRLKLLEAHRGTVAERDELVLHLIALYNAFGRSEEALRLLQGRKFLSREGGEGSASMQYEFARLLLGWKLLRSGKREQALEEFTAALTYPESLGEGKLPGTPEEHIHYAIGIARNAKAAFRVAARWKSKAVEMKYYRGLALLKLGKRREARRAFQALIAAGREVAGTPGEYAYFPFEHPHSDLFLEDLDGKNKAEGCYLTGLGMLGLGRARQAAAQFAKVARRNPNHRLVQIRLALGCRGGNPKGS
jgi:tetratricopeptide (TPR) repeat protein